MTTNQLLNALHRTIELIEANKLSEAEKVFSLLAIVDTPDHLAQPTSVRHLIWDLYEFLVVSNEHYMSREEILQSYADIVGSLQHNKK